MCSNCSTNTLLVGCLCCSSCSSSASPCPGDSEQGGYHKGILQTEYALWIFLYWMKHIHIHIHRERFMRITFKIIECCVTLVKGFHQVQTQKPIAYSQTRAYIRSSSYTKQI